MEIATLEEPDAPSAVPSDLGGAAGLSTLQRAWARCFVLSGGNALKAAIMAGYSERSAKVSAYRNCCNPTVLAYVQDLCTANVKAHLPTAILALAQVASNPDADDRARVMAATALLDRGGLKPASGPSVQVNIQMNGRQAQGVIAKVWEVRAQRLGIEMSDIPAPMSDTIEASAIHLDDGDDDEAAGGGAAPGSRPAGVPNTSPLTRIPEKNYGGMFDEPEPEEGSEFPSGQAAPADGHFRRDRLAANGEDDAGPGPGEDEAPAGQAAVGGSDWSHPDGLRGAMIEKERGDGIGGRPRPGDDGRRSGARTGDGGAAGAAAAWRRATAARARIDEG